MPPYCTVMELSGQRNLIIGFKTVISFRQGVELPEHLPSQSDALHDGNRGTAVYKINTGFTATVRFEYAHRSVVISYV